jgi:hypothetical protein
VFVSCLQNTLSGGKILDQFIFCSLRPFALHILLTVWALRSPVWDCPITKWALDAKLALQPCKLPTNKAKLLIFYKDKTCCKFD